MAEAFDPLAYLRLAEELAAGTADEARLRSAVGRTYYALFLLAREKTGIREASAAHRRVIQAVRARQGFRTAGDQLDSLRWLRTVADYQLLPVNPADQQWNVNWSRAQLLAARLLPKLQAW